MNGRHPSFAAGTEPGLQTVWRFFSPNLVVSGGAAVTAAEFGVARVAIRFRVASQNAQFKNIRRTQIGHISLLGSFGLAGDQNNELLFYLCSKIIIALVRYSPVDLP
jgi:hypothetical protein